MMNKRQIILIVIVIAIGAVLGGLILTWDKVGTPEAAHGGHDKSDLSHATHDNHEHGDEDEADSTSGAHHILKPKISRQGVKAKAANQARGLKAGNCLPKMASV